MRTMKTLVITLALLLMAASAHAYVYATDVDWTGTNAPGSERSDVLHALGAPDGDFLSLGWGGAAVFTFGTLFDTSGTVVEITNGDRNGWKEYADIWVGTGTPTLDPTGLTFVGTILNNVLANTIDLTGLGGPFSFLLIVDVTGDYADGHAGDGFDVDAVGVTAATPIPGAVWLLGTGLLGLVGLRRRITG